MNTRTRIGLATLAALALLALPAAPAAAQSGALSNFTRNPEADQRREVRKPSALPGARGAQQAAPVAPAERAPADLPPTEALFDAINRGDIAAARDAIGRGADIDGRNILGLTPLELAIDLGRNDLTFLLLSMRGAGASSAPPPPAATAARAPSRPPVAQAPERHARTATPRPAPPRERQASADAVGTPAPQAGFLGFGGPTR